MGISEKSPSSLVNALSQSNRWGLPQQIDCRGGFCFCVDAKGNQIGKEVNQSQVDSLKCYKKETRCWKCSRRSFRCCFHSYARWKHSSVIFFQFCAVNKQCDVIGLIVFISGAFKGKIWFEFPVAGRAHGPCWIVCCFLGDGAPASRAQYLFGSPSAQGIEASPINGKN